MRRSPAKPASPSAAEGLTFLLSQLGAHTSAQFAARLEPLGLKPPHAGILKAIDQTDGLSQQALCQRLGVFSSRLVGLIDELEQRKLVERRDNPADRRSYAIHLTEAGREAQRRIRALARQLRDSLCAALSEPERELLAELLSRIATEQGLAPGVHPGWKNLKDAE
jgi:DNA-binding MarR family transcriptional regulator